MPLAGARPRYRVGARVEGRFRGGAKYFRGVIVAVNRDGTFAIDYDDGDKEQSVDALLIRTPSSGRAPLSRTSSASNADGMRNGRGTFGSTPSSPSGTVSRHHRTTATNSNSDNLRAGMRVEAKYRGKGRFFPARIVRENRDGTFSIAFDDGDTDSQMERQNIRMRGVAGQAFDEDLPQPGGAAFERNARPSARATAANQRRRGSIPAENFGQGDRVQARYHGGSKFYHGVIERCNVDGTYDIKYNDGDKERNIPSTMIKLSDAFDISASTSSFGNDDRVVGGRGGVGGGGGSGSSAIDDIIIGAFNGGAVGGDLDDYYQLFEMFDMHANGKITAKEFERGVAKMGLAFSRRDIADLTAHFDKNGDGRINYKDFLGAIEKLKNENQGGGGGASSRSGGGRGSGGGRVVHSNYGDDDDDDDDDADNGDDDNSPLERGDRVTCRYKGGAKYYPGHVMRVRMNGTYDISYDDGDSDMSVRRDFIRVNGGGSTSAKPRRSQSPGRRTTGGRGGGGGRFDTELDVEEIVYKAGDQVEGRFQGKSRWYKGKITRCNRDGTYAIAYVDGDFEAAVQPALMRSLNNNNNSNGAPASRRRSPDKQHQEQQGTDDGNDALHVGDQVEARFGGKGRWYSGKITRVNRDGSYAISYTDGDRETSVARHLIRAMNSASSASKRRGGHGGELVVSDSEGDEQQLKVGDQVEGLFQGKNRWYKGKITRVNRNGTYAIAYVDGDFEASVARKLIRTTEHAAPTTTTTRKSVMRGGAGNAARGSGRGRGGAGAMASESELDEEPMLRVGDRVEGLFGGKSRWYKGKIVGVNKDGTYAINYDDGDRETAVSRDLIRIEGSSAGSGGGGGSSGGTKLAQPSDTYRVGDRVEGLFRGGKRWYKGKVVRVNRNGTYAINYDDGDKENSVNSSMMRAIGGAETEGRTRRSGSASPSRARRRGGTARGFGGDSDSELDSVGDAQEQRFVRGERIKGLYKGGSRYFAGKISRVNADGTYDIAYDDGDSEFGINASMIQALNQKEEEGEAALLVRGDLVEARFKGGRRFLPGRVRAVHANGNVDIEYDDPSAGLERSVRPALVRVAATSKSSPSRRRQPQQQPQRRQPQYARGDRVEGRFRKGTKYFAGEIARANMDDGTVDINYDDGDVEKNVDVRLVRMAMRRGGGRRRSNGLSDIGDNDGVSDMDEDGDGDDGGISDSELQEAVQKAVRGGVDNAVLDDYRAAFRLFDLNGDGIVSEREFERTVAKLKLRFSRAQVRQLIDRFDRNGDGGINYTDFLRLLSSGRRDSRLRRNSVLSTGDTVRRGKGRGGRGGRGGGAESDSAMSEFDGNNRLAQGRGRSRSRRSSSRSSGGVVSRQQLRNGQSSTTRSRNARGDDSGWSSDDSIESLREDTRSRSRSRSQSAGMKSVGRQRSRSRGGDGGFDSEDMGSDESTSTHSGGGGSGGRAKKEGRVVRGVLDTLVEDIKEMGGSRVLIKLRRACEDADRNRIGELSARHIGEALRRASLRVPATRDMQAIMAHFGKSRNCRTMPWEPLVDRLSGKQRHNSRSRSGSSRKANGIHSRSRSRSRRRFSNSASDSDGNYGIDNHTSDSNSDNDGYDSNNQYDSDSSLSSVGSQQLSPRGRGGNHRRRSQASELDESTVDKLAEQFRSKVRDKYTRFVQKFDSKRDGTVPRKTFIQILNKSGFKLSGEQCRQILTVFGEDSRGDGSRNSSSKAMVRYKEFDEVLQRRRSQQSARTDQMTVLRDNQGLDGETDDPVVRDALVKLRKVFRQAVDSGLASDYRDVFEMLDQDGSGTVSTMEFHGALERLGFDLAKEEKDKLVGKFTLASLADTIDYREFLRLCSSGLGPERWSNGKGGQIAGSTYEGQVEADVRRKLRQWCAKSNKGKKAILVRFRRHDKAARGFVRKRDLKAVAQAFKWKLTKEELETLMSRFDLGSTGGRFSYREFVAFIGMKDEAVYGLQERLRDFVKTMAQQSVDVLQCFQMFDRNHDGKVSPDELASAMAKLGFPMSRDEARELVRRIDINRDGKISYAEFVRAFGNTGGAAVAGVPGGAPVAGVPGGAPVAGISSLVENPAIRLASAKEYTSGLFYDWTMGMSTGEETAGGKGGGGGSSSSLAAPGSVGAWLEATASPIERRNFFELLKLVGAFERRLGLQQRREGGGVDMQDGQVVVQLGSKLKAAIKFYV